MNDNISQKVIQTIVETLDIPPSAYEKAEARYKTLGEWLQSSESGKYSPHVYPQGSFRLGTVIRPLNSRDSYDLDLGCRLRSGITKASHTQEFLKTLIGKDLEAYRRARHIEEKLEEMHRCWRLAYADELSFHMDVVPSIPQDLIQINALQEAMIRQGVSNVLSEGVAKHAGAITDNRHQHYRSICDNWRISNSEGYALWFESRLKLAEQFLQKRAFETKAAKIDEMPTWRWKSPLQQTVQILKRHRDVMFKNSPNGKPISIILTTLSAAAYRGEDTLEKALQRILTDMGEFVLSGHSRVPNPVNPAEDFADKWYDQKYKHLNLENNFWTWLEQAKIDFNLIVSASSPETIIKQANAKFGINLDENTIKTSYDGMGLNIISKQKTHVISETPPKPWRKG